MEIFDKTAGNKEIMVEWLFFEKFRKWELSKSEEVFVSVTLNSINKWIWSH